MSPICIHNQKKEATCKICTAWAQYVKEINPPGKGSPVKPVDPKKFLLPRKEGCCGHRKKEI